MGLFSTGKFIKWDKFINGELDDFLKSSDFISKGRKHLTYTNELIITADTETSHTIIDDNEIGWVYQWAICICKTVDDPNFIYGRTPVEFMECLKHLIDVLDLGSDRFCAIYFHNFSYDYEYLKKWIRDELDDTDDLNRRILAIGPHKIISYQTTSGIQFRCSYRLSNASLDFWSREILHTRYKKLVGTVDYDLVHFQDSKLTRTDWRYMFYDVIVDAECVQKAMEQDNDDISSIPCTSTGYVRRATRRRFNRDKNARWQFKKAALDRQSYNMLRMAQQGGYTHASRFHAGETVDIKKHEEYTRIAHFDMRSFYPSMQRVKKYPISKLVLSHRTPNDTTLQQIYRDKNKCHLFYVCFKNLTLHAGIPFPIISSSKVKKGKMGQVDITEDNGRCLQIEGIFVLALTDEDFEIIREQYDIEKMIILEVWSAQAGYLPKWLTDTIDEYYKGKSDWKTKTKINKEDEVAASMLQKVKNMLNGIYGMTATNPVHESFYDTDNGEWLTKEMDIQEELDKFYDNFNSFMWLQWGVWCTSWARYELIREAEAIGWNNILYADTDSLFFLSNVEIEAGIEKRNLDRYNNAIALNAFITSDAGKIVTYDAFEDEDEKIIKFRALHSKCYAYVTDDNKLHVTVAGVSKKGHGVTREQELKSIDRLDHGFVFKKCGGTTIKYFDHEIADEYIDNHHIVYSSSAIITPVEKTIKFEELDFDDSQQYIDIA